MKYEYVAKNKSHFKISITESFSNLGQWYAYFSLY